MLRRRKTNTRWFHTSGSSGGPQGSKQRHKGREELAGKEAGKVLMGPRYEQSRHSSKSKFRHWLSHDTGQTINFSEPQFPSVKLGQRYLLSRSGARVSHWHGLKGAPHLLFIERALQEVSKHSPFQSVPQTVVKATFRNSDVAISSVRTLNACLGYKTSASRVTHMENSKKSTLQAILFTAKN